MRGRDGAVWVPGVSLVYWLENGGGGGYTESLRIVMVLESLRWSANHGGWGGGRGGGAQISPYSALNKTLFRTEMRHWTSKIALESVVPVAIR